MSVAFNKPQSASLAWRANLQIMNAYGWAQNLVLTRSEITDLLTDRLRSVVDPVQETIKSSAIIISFVKKVCHF